MLQYLAAWYSQSLKAEPRSKLFSVIHFLLSATLRSHYLEDTALAFGD
jgi:hypothetical protein